MKVRSFSIFVFLCFQTLTPLLSQNFWTPLQGPFGIQVDKFAATNDGHAVVLNYQHGLFCSSDGGDTWENCNDDMDFPFTSIHDLAADPNGDIFLSDFGKLRRLDPQDNTWDSLSQGGLINSSVNFIGIHPQGYVYITNGSGETYRSFDGGVTWSQVLAYGQIQSFVKQIFIFGNDNNFFITQLNYAWKVYRFSDDGSNLTLIYSTEDWPISSLTYHPPSGKIFIGASELLVSANGGSTWQPVDLPGTAWGNTPHLSVKPSGSIIVGSTTNVYISYDAGLSWQQADPPFGGRSGTSLVFKYTQNAAYAFYNICPSQSLLRLKDNGANWEHLEKSFPYPNTESITTNHDGHIYADLCGSNLLDWSPDGGAHWEAFKITDEQLGVYQLKVNSTGHLFAFATDNVLYRSLDGGLAWEAITPPDFDEITSLLVITPQSELLLYTGSTCWKSLDNGDTWQEWNDNLNFLPTIVDFHPNGSMYALSKLENAIMRSWDGGTTWDTVSTDYQYIFHFHITNDGSIYFAGQGPSGGNELYASFDEMTSTQTFDNFYGSPLGITSDIEGDIVVSVDGKIWISQDHAASWDSITTGLPQPQSALRPVCIDHNQYLYAGGAEDVTYKTHFPMTNKNVVKGKIWFDENQNCQFDAGELPLNSWLVKAEGPDTYVKSTGFDGQYVLTLPPGNWSLNSLMPNPYWTSNCTNSTDISFSGGSDTVYIDFPVSAVSSCQDLRVDVSNDLLRRCFPSKYHFQFCNKGTANLSDAMLEVKLDSFFQFNSATLPVIGQNGNNYTFSVGELGVNECRNMILTVVISCDAVLGQEHCIEAHLLPDTCISQSSFDVECRPNIGSFDPNDKSAFVGGHFEQEEVHPDSTIEYLIRFQNTGTDTAFNVVIEDRLSQWLDPLSVVPGASSHPYEFEMDGEGRLRFVFTNIMLPDSNINEVASHGFVKFRISQKTNTPDGTIIPNKANIFFDFNAPVLTNMVELTVVTPTTPAATASMSSQRKLTVFPNPSYETAFVEIDGMDNEILKFQLFDILGRKRMENYFTSPVFLLERKEFGSGIYFILIEKNGVGIGNGKVIFR